MKTLVTTINLVFLSLILLLVGGCIEVNVHVVAISEGDQTIQRCALEEKTLDDIVRYPQETSVWCWAASAQMVINYHLNVSTINDTDDTDNDPETEITEVNDSVESREKPLSQCVIAGRALGYSENRCCTNELKASSDEGCHTGFYPERALRAFGFNYSDPEFNPGFDYLWARLTNNVCAGQPIIVEEHFIGGGGHSNVLYGFLGNKGNDLKDAWVNLYPHPMVEEDSSSESQPPGLGPVFFDAGAGTTEAKTAADFEQVSFAYDLYFEEGRDDPKRAFVVYIFDIEPIGL